MIRIALYCDYPTVLPKLKENLEKSGFMPVENGGDAALFIPQLKKCGWERQVLARTSRGGAVVIVRNENTPEAERLLKGSRPKPTEVRVGPYTVHLEKHLVSDREGEAIPLTVKEYDLLLHLAANQGLVLKRGEILNAVWGYTFYGSDRVVDDTIRRLRKKLPAIEIRTLYGLGYCLTEGDHESVFD